jgi:hypothetical protein
MYEKDVGYFIQLKSFLFWKYYRSSGQVVDYFSSYDAARQVIHDLGNQRYQKKPIHIEEGDI